ncbi:MAG: hypothetical protein ACFFA3_09570 [Promethearchaeota archaeon]
MSKKMLIISVVALAIGTSIIPGGMLIENYINETVYNSVDEGLLGIEEEAIPMVEPMIKEMGIPRTLRGIRDTGISVVGEMVEMTFVAVLMEIMAVTGGNVSDIWYDPLGLENFFNNHTDGTWFILQGVSKNYGINLSFTEDAQNRLLYGNSTRVPGYIPGILGFLNDTSTGAGVAMFLDQFNKANSSSNNDLNITMQENYNCTWLQLSKLEGYITNYLINSIIPLLIAFDLHAEYMPQLSGLNSVEAIGKALLLEQWANGTILNSILYEDGIDFSELIEGVNESLVGFEVGRLTPSNITRKVAYALFDEVNYPNALTNDTGINTWISAKTNTTIRVSLMNEFNLTQSQIDMILFWLFDESFKENIVPELMKLPPPDGVGMNITEYARVLLLEQWANGTVDGRVLYPFGFPLPLKGGIKYGFEVGYQGKELAVLRTNMLLKSAEALWDSSNEYSLVNKKGLKKWYNLVEDPFTPVRFDLLENNYLRNNELNMILDWLPEFREKLMPYLAQEDMNLPSDSRTFSNSIKLGMVIPGGILIGLGILGLARYRLRKL